MVQTTNDVAMSLSWGAIEDSQAVADVLRVATLPIVAVNTQEMCWPEV